nr:hypothetical protein [Tanacetum cinerariifolium]
MSEAKKGIGCSLSQGKDAIISGIRRLGTGSTLYVHGIIQEVSPDAADSGPIFDSEPVQKVSNNDHNNVFAIESEHPEKSESVHDTYPIEQDEH